MRKKDNEVLGMDADTFDLVAALIGAGIVGIVLIWIAWVVFL